MIRLGLALAGTLWLAGCGSETPTPATRPAMTPTGPIDLAQFRWQNRLVLMFAPADGGLLAEQRDKLLADRDALVDRDLVLFEIVGPDGGLIRRVADDATEQLAPDDARQLRLKYNVMPGDFVVLLVGKDGGEKRREHSVVEPSVLFDQIDSMPMRQREMREDE